MTTDQSILLAMDADKLGETLRAFTFVGEGYGCYSDFDVRDDALEWTPPVRVAFWEMLGWEDPHLCASLGQGFEFEFIGLDVHCCWLWDGDGVLVYLVREKGGDPLRVVQSADCKKDYVWRDELGTEPVGVEL